MHTQKNTQPGAYDLDIQYIFRDFQELKINVLLNVIKLSAAVYEL